MWLLLSLIIFFKKCWREHFQGRPDLIGSPWIACNRDNRVGCAGSCQLFLIQSMSRDSRLPQRTANGRGDGFEYVHAKCRGARERYLQRMALSSAIDPFVQFTWDPAAINKRDETRRAQSGTTVAMSRGMHRLLSNGCREEDDDHDDDEKDEESLNAPSEMRADPSLDCIKAFPKWAWESEASFLSLSISPSLSFRWIFSIWLL